jgi:hypothetical protein
VVSTADHHSVRGHGGHGGFSRRGGRPVIRVIGGRGACPCCATSGDRPNLRPRRLEPDAPGIRRWATVPVPARPRIHPVSEDSPCSCTSRS